MNVILIDVSHCSGCMNCQISCKDEYCGNDWRPYAAAQPMTGQFWCKVQENVRGTIPKVKIHYISRMCAQCKNAPCVDACEAGAIWRREDGLVLISPDECSGCGKCVDSCPLEAIYFNETEKIAQKCTGCAHLLDNGHKLPRCVEACPTDAMRVIDESELPDNAVPAVDGSLEGRLYYINIPGRFIGATIYDPTEKEVIIGARCTLKGAGKEYKTETDSYGDFWFRDLPEEMFTLTIEQPGFDTLRYENLDTHNDINLGDVPMIKRGR